MKNDADDTKGQKPVQKPAANRDDRLKAALKANMGRRKAQARKRAQAPVVAEQDEAKEE